MRNESHIFMFNIFSLLLLLFVQASSVLCTIILELFNSLSGVASLASFFVVRYPRYLAYVRDAGPRPANFGRPDATNARCTTDFNPTDDERVVDHQAMHLLTATDV